MKVSINTKCFCGSGLKYKKCCQLLHKGKRAVNALELMKSRYSAYCIGDINYLMRTTHHENIDFNNDKKQWKTDVEVFCKSTQFLGLRIIDFKNHENDAFVTFQVNYKTQHENTFFIEESRFLKLDNIWYYHSGIIS